jgi:hypothetical protein
MATSIRLTITELAASIERQYGTKIPNWKLRRVLDSMESSRTIDLQRVAKYRTVCGDDVGIVASEPRRQGWLESEAVQC